MTRCQLFTATLLFLPSCCFPDGFALVLDAICNTHSDTRSGGRQCVYVAVPVLRQFFNRWRTKQKEQCVLTYLAARLSVGHKHQQQTTFFLQFQLTRQNKLCMRTATDCYFSVCLFVCLSVSLCLPVCLSVCFSLSLPSLSLSLSLSLSARTTSC